MCETLVLLHLLGDFRLHAKDDVTRKGWHSGDAPPVHSRHLLAQQHLPPTPNPSTSPTDSSQPPCQTTHGLRLRTKHKTKPKPKPKTKDETSLPRPPPTLQRGLPTPLRMPSRMAPLTPPPLMPNSITAIPVADTAEIRPCSLQFYCHISTRSREEAR